jgi:two-component system, OmpR family, phosphate regulon sensor histidine kinase PhoR
MEKVFGRTLLSLVATLVVAVAFWWFANLKAALLFFSLTLTLLFIHHAWMMARLSRWIEKPNIGAMPSAYGAWDDLFKSLWTLVKKVQDSEARLSETLVRFRQAGEALPDGVVTLTSDGAIEWINPAAARHFNIDAKSLQGQPFTALVPDDTVGKALVTTNDARPIRFARLQDDLPRILNLRMIPFGKDRVLVFSEDVTRSEQIETMRRDFVANVSHELRTPLTVLRGFAETLQDAEEDNPALRQRAVARMIEQSVRMQRLVEDLLMLSRLEDPNYRLAQDEIDIGALAQSIVADAEALSAGRHTINLSVAPIALRGNGDEIRSAFTNLVTNAVRYTPTGGSINISWERRGDELWWSVRDSGEGIAPEHLARLTERFYRVDKGRSRTNLIGGGGTGLGLSIVKHVMLRHAGRLDIQSKVGQGSTFSCVVPAI